MHEAERTLKQARTRLAGVQRRLQRWEPDSPAIGSLELAIGWTDQALSELEES